MPASASRRRRARKTFPFAGSGKGGDRAAAIDRVHETRRNFIDPEARLRDVLPASLTGTVKRARTQALVLDRLDRRDGNGERWP